MKILIISNGYGEDLIAANLIRAIQQSETDSKTDKITILPLPLVGEGLEYKQLGLTPLITNPMLPSGGFVRNFKALFIDIKTGLFHQIKTQLSLIKTTSKQCDLTICVGDTFCLLMGNYFNKTPIYFLPTAKSEFFMPHMRIEKWLFKKCAAHVYPRDALTAQVLKKAGVKVSYLGNPMMDGFSWNDNAFGFDTQESDTNKKPPVIGLVPGSRDEAYFNLRHMLAVTELIHKKDSSVKFVFAKAKSLTQDLITEKSLWKDWAFFNPQHDDTQPQQRMISKLINKHSNYDISITENFADVIGNSTLILGLAGTANEQAIYFGVPVISFPGFGPQSTPKRFEEQNKLLQNQLIFIRSKDIDEIATEALAIIQTKKRRPANAISALPGAPDSSSSKITNHILAELAKYGST